MEDAQDKIIGQAGESLAEEYLLGHGHEILQKNYRAGHCEIDIVSHTPGCIHIVEVKTRRDPVQVDPQDSVVRRKQRNLERAAGQYLSRDLPKKLSECECVFDIVAIVFHPDGSHSLEYFPEAWIPIYTSVNY